MSKYLAYCFLYDDAADLRCDFEILTDEISSMIGLLRSLLDDVDRAAAPELADDLCKINELMYHINPSLRTKTLVTEEELEWLVQKTSALQKSLGAQPSKDSTLTFYIPQGCTQAACSHVIRSKCKTLVRLLSRHHQQGNAVGEILFDFCNLYSGYFYFLALWFNKNHGEKECPFVSRAY
ncbi:MAG: ATP--cob(I)alamin adenosyltransferase [Holophagales bacterium]|jgi:cob(I)alamin adenosyltransferase|nr:ATP--cob(I)alamin adenosyltransferase [Holophagales bacterium]